MNHPKIIKAGVRDVSFGSNVTVVEPCNLYECEIGDDAFIGPFVEIQQGVVVGAGSRIQSHSFICEKVIIGKDCFIGHGVTFINDTFQSGKISFDPNDWLETMVGDGVIIGSNATILPVQIASGVVVGAGSVVTNNLLETGIYAGNPARFLRKK
tara:strand:- start:1951 stop:2412 length:462 start_codon:yes stop_codon:yes gene_type:complete